MSAKDRLEDLEPLEAWVADLITPPPGRTVAAVLLDAVEACARPQAIGLWHESNDGWQVVRERGPAYLLPSRAHVRAVLAGQLDGELGDRARVIRVGEPGAGVAVALGVCTAAGIDRVLALLATYSAVTHDGEAWPAPLPDREPDVE